MNQMENKIDIKGLTLPKMREWFTEIGEKPFHANQVFRWLYIQKVTDFNEMTNISKSLRDKLKELASISSLEIDTLLTAADGTTKIRYRLIDGEMIETVLIPDKKRLTLCISSQVGCAVNCRFCFTAKMGFIRSLTTSEIVDQVMFASMIEGFPPITNVVFMGMGEPLNNLENVIDASDILLAQHGFGFSKKRITVSTSGIVPAITEFKNRLGVRLAVSLNATTDAQRTDIMPINKKWNIKTLLDTLRALTLEPREKITIEYVMIRGLNDTLEDAARLHQLLKGIPTKINLIPFNPHSGSTFKRPFTQTIEAFHQYLYNRKEDILLRRSRGDDIGAACGQLVVSEKIK